jgi:hypothetical protein
MFVKWDIIRLAFQTLCFAKLKSFSKVNVQLKRPISTSRTNHCQIYYSMNIHNNYRVGFH